MSLKYRDSAGTETPVAGLNGTSGELVPSVALMQSGTAHISMPNTSALTDLFTVTVTFDTPFEDTDYVLNVDQCEVSEAEINRVYNKTTTGFTVAVKYNRQLTAVPSYNVTARIPWQAFKLMTDTVHEADSAHIAQNTANFASAFSDTVSYAVGDYVTYNNVLYRCTTAHTAGVWVAGHFTQVTVGESLKPMEAKVPTTGLGTGINKQDIVSGAANTVLNIPAYHFSTGLMYLSISGIGTALLSYETDTSGNLNLKVVAGIGISLTGLGLFKGTTSLGTFSRSGEYIAFAANYTTTIRTDYASL